MTKQAQENSYLNVFLPFLRPYLIHIVFALLSLVITTGSMLSLGKGVQFLINHGLSSGKQSDLKQAILVFSGLVLLVGIGGFCRFYLISWIGEKVVTDIRKAVFAHLLQLSPSFFEKNSPSEIQSRITSDTTLMQSVIGSSLSITLRSSLMLVGGTLFLLILHFKLTLILLSCVPFVVTPVMYFGRKVRKLSRHSQDEMANVGRCLSQALRHIKVIQAFTHEKHDKNRFSNTVEQAFDVNINRIRQRAFLTLLATLLSMTSIGIMLWFGGKDVVSGNITSGDLAGFLFYAIIVAGAMAALSEISGQLQQAAGAAERIMELLNIKSDIKDGIQLVEKTFYNPSDQPELPIIRFQNVYFSYPTRPNYPILKGVDFSIKQEETIALVGPSGSGKSTIFELLLRFYDPKSGEVQFLDHPIKSYQLQSWRQQIALVPQETTLFDQTVAENLGYANRQASQDELRSAASKANAHEFIQQLSYGYETLLGEDGIRLSGGQRQRIAIARAILKDAPILLLDEVTNSLDADSEYKVQAALNVLMKNKTTLVIAHRLATVLNADRIMVLDQGQIVAQGTHNELVKTSVLYKHLADLQFNQLLEK